jgi:glucose-1-phosphate thymidylyltransferase
MKGIVLAGGSGTRLYPITKGVSKQLLPIYDKPMVYYPISVLMLAGIREILIISTPYDIDGFKRLLGDGSDYGVRFEYAVQPKPEGLAQAFSIGAEFIGDDSVCLVLGDNIFHGAGFSPMLREARRVAEEEQRATIFGYWVNNPQRYGVAEFDSTGRCISIEEKPHEPKSNYAVVGLYFYPNRVKDVARNIEPSARGEYEITSVNQVFLEAEELSVQTLGRGFAWLDTGTHDSLSEASTYIEVLEKRQGLKVGCLEEIAYTQGWIDEAKLRELAEPMRANQYGEYLLSLIGKKGQTYQSVMKVIKTDIEGVVIIEPEVFGDSREDVDRFFIDVHRDENLLTHSEQGSVVAMLNIVELQTDYGPTAYLYAIATAAEWRGQGFASELIRQAIDVSRERGYKAVMLIPADEKLVEYYKRFGFGEPSCKLDFSNGYDLGTGDREKDIAMVLEL